MSPWTLCECDRCGCDARLSVGPDGLPRYRGLPVGAAVNDDYPLDDDAPKYRPGPLAGGKDGRRKRA
jgi:hypothetical protein